MSSSRKVARRLPTHRRDRPRRVWAHPGGDRPRPLNPGATSRVDRLHRLGHPIDHDMRGPACATGLPLFETGRTSGGRKAEGINQRTEPVYYRQPLLNQAALCARGRNVDGPKPSRTSTPETNKCSEQPKTQSPLSDSNRRPLPYHGRIRVLQAFTDAHTRARNPCKQPQYDNMECTAVTADLRSLWISWTRSGRAASAFRLPDLQAGAGPVRPAAAGLRVGPRCRLRRATPWRRSPRLLQSRSASEISWSTVSPLAQVTLHQAVYKPVVLPSSIAEAAVALGWPKLRLPGRDSRQLHARARGVASRAVRMARQTRDRPRGRSRL
jgi:hypothetical protein